MSGELKSYTTTAFLIIAVTSVPPAPPNPLPPAPPLLAPPCPTHTRTPSGAWISSRKSSAVDDS
jgi:hypothetical protein